MYQGTSERFEECCLEQRCFANKSFEFMEWKTKLRVHSEQKQKKRATHFFEVLWSSRSRKSGNAEFLSCQVKCPSAGSSLVKSRHNSLMQGLRKYVYLHVSGLPQAMRLSDTPCSKHLPQNHVHSQSMALTEVLENESPVKKQH